jgi:hypothetical protein
MKNRTLCSALMAVALVGCTMNGKKMFGFGSSSSTSESSPAASGSSPTNGEETRSTNEADYITPSGVYDGIPAGHVQEQFAIEKDRDVIHHAHQLLQEKNSGKDTEPGAASLETLAQSCREAAGRLHRVGAKEVDIAKEKMPTAQIEARVCAPLAKKALTWKEEGLAARKAADAERDAENAAFEQTLKAANITGDRLRYAIRWRYDRLYTTGGKLLETPKAIKAARVIFQVKRHGDIYSYYRTEFAANDKIVTDTRKEYELDPGLDGFR